MTLETITVELGQILNRVIATQHAVHHILDLQEKLMSGFDDLNTAVAANTAAVTANTAAVTAEIAAVNSVIATLKAGGITDAQAETLAQTLQSSVTAIGASTASLNTEATTAGQ